MEDNSNIKENSKENFEKIDVEKINKVLLKIAKAFNDKELLWAVGASKLMEKYDILISDDIDFFVARKHLDDAFEILNKLGEQIEIPFNASFLSQSSYCFIIDDVFIKLVSGLNIRHSTGIYRYSFKTSSIDSTTEINGVAINYMSLEDWFILYQMMPGRLEYSKMILEYFKKTKKINTIYLERALNKALPTNTRALLQNLKFKFGS